MGGGFAATLSDTNVTLDETMEELDFLLVDCFRVGPASAIGQES